MRNITASSFKLLFAILDCALGLSSCTSIDIQSSLMPGVGSHLVIKTSRSSIKSYSNLGTGLVQILITHFALLPPPSHKSSFLTTFEWNKIIMTCFKV